MDLIDMRSLEYDGFNWIFNAKDHFTKYSWLFPLTSKEAVNVVTVLKSIFYQFGPPRILQSDNGREFVAKVILDLKKLWPGLLIINGRPRHPQSQGLVERGNAVVQQMLGKWLSANTTKDWPSGLGPVMFAINTSIARTIKKTPFEVVFEQTPRMDDDAWRSVVSQLTKQQSDETHETNDDKSDLLEENLPLDVAEVIKEVFELDGASDELEMASEREELPCTNVGSEGSAIDQRTTDGQVLCSSIELDQEELSYTIGSTSDFAQPNDTSPASNRHKRIRDTAEESYLNNAQSELTKYHRRSSKRQRTYLVDDIVGLQVPNVDRTNTSSTVLPCKVVRLHDESEETLYTVATTDGIIREKFPSASFIDLRSSNFAALRLLDAETLPSLTFIQACQIHCDFRSADTCRCNGDCTTNRFKCKKKDRKCCSKCHGGNGMKCKNC